MERLFLTILLLFTVTVSGCGGSQKESTVESEYDCSAAIEDLRYTPESTLCSFAAIERMELQIHALREDCGSSMDASLEGFLANKMFRAQKCIEKEQALSPLKTACRDHLNALDAYKDCLNESCQDALLKTQEIVTNCSAKSLGTSYVTAATQWNRIFQERMLQGNQLRALVELKDKCDSAKANLKQDNALNTLEEVAALINQTDELKMTHPGGSQMAQSAQRALTSCQAPLKGAVEWVVAIYADELNRPEIRSNKGRKRRRLKKVEKQYEHLMKIDAPALYPNIETPLVELMRSFNYVPDIPPPSRNDTPVASAQVAEPVIENSTPPKEVLPSTPAAEVAPATDNQDNTNNNFVKKCRKLGKKRTQYEAKIKQYQRKKNERKVSAYQKKLDKINTKMLELVCD